jgi:chromosomal replication initiation ATPase DnaA
MVATQYALPLSFPVVFDDGNFYLSDCNRDAYQWVTNWPNWPAHALVLYGAAGSGKTHLGHIWARQSKASALSLPGVTLKPDTMRGNWLVEGIDKWKDERSLFHLLNYSKENKTFLLLTSAVAPAQLPFTLPDLTSRLLALPSAGIAEPDDDALAAVMRKQFADRQLKVSDEAVAFLLPRMERSFARVGELVATLDSEALQQQRELTVPFLKKLLGY